MARILVEGMFHPGFLDEATRKELAALGRDGKAESGATRRPNALLLLFDR
ncbi:MAG: hypothetical protein ACREC0_01850 [Methylocella sp.]